MKKRVISLILVCVMVLGMLPVWEAQGAVTEETFDNGKLSFGVGGTAYCPACEKTVAWTSVSGERSNDYWLSNGGHYYLSGDLTYTGPYSAIYVNAAKETPACLHLNGYSIKASNNGNVFTFNGSGKMANIMGNGMVTGTKSSDGYTAATIDMKAENTLNLYGGTFTKSESSVNPVVFDWGATVNFYEGAQIIDPGVKESPTGGCVVLWNAGSVFNMHGGQISGGKAKNSGGNVHINNGSFIMHGGTISGGTAVAWHGGNVYLKVGSFTMNGGSISGGSATYYGDNVYIDAGTTAKLSGGMVTDGNVYVKASGTTTLSGTPEISELKLPENVTVTVEGLMSGADVAVSANGVFTNTGIADNLGAFRSANGTDSIIANGEGALSYFSNARLSPDASGYAVCPVCGTSVKWTAISGSLSSTQWLKDTGHYYLTGNVTYAGEDQAFYSPTGGVAKAACLHLNGYNITATAGRAVHCGDGTLNIMGNGVVSGNAAASYGGASFNTWGNGKLNLYGGTYTKGASQYPVFYIGAYSVDLYSGATITGTGTTPSGYALILAENANSALNMYGGTIENGKSTGGCGGVRFYNGDFHMYGGTIQNCTGTLGGNLHVYNAGRANISGGKIKNGSAYTDISEGIVLSGAPVIQNLVAADGVAVGVGALTEGAKITVNNTCATTADNSQLQSYVDAGYFVTSLEGKQLAADGSNLIVVDIPVEEPEVPAVSAPTYITGDVLYETDFENETAGQLPAGWSAGYSEGSAQDGTLTSFGWGSGGTMTAKVESYGSYGKVFHFTSGNNDAFAAMGEIPTTNYLYEAVICVDYGYGSFGLANNYYASTDQATGTLFSAIYPKGDAAKYTYKGAGLSGSQPWTTSYTPTSGQIVNLQILSLNGQNYIMYEGEIVARCAARLQGQGVDHPGFYTCYGGIYVLGVKVTEVFAADVNIDAARVSLSGENTAAMGLEVGFAKNQGLYTKYADSDSSKLKFGVVIATGDAALSDLTQTTQGANIIHFGDSDKTEDEKKIVCTTALVLSEHDYETRYGVRPFVEVDGICFYGDTSVYMPAELANGAYMSATESGKAQIARSFGACEHFTADGGKEVTFTLFSDFHYIAGMYPATISDLKTILKRADDADASFVLSAGDFTNDMAGSPELYNTYRNYITEEGEVLPAYNVYGNHELEFGNSMETVTWTLTNDEYTDHTVVWGTADGSFEDYIGYYYFESDGFRVIALDSEHSYNPTTQQWEHNRPGSSGAPAGNTHVGSLGPVQLQWLETVLMDAAEKDIPCIVIAHDGFTGLNWGNTSPDSETVRALYAKANDANPGTVLMSINGHIHTDHQGWNDGVFYLDTNTVRNNWWQETAVDHYTDEHTFMFEEYDDEGDLIATYEKKYSELSMGKKTWFSEDPISCNITLSDTGAVNVDGVKSQWAYDIVPDAATTVSGVECEITSGIFWNCERNGHIEQLTATESQYYTLCGNTQCAYESVHKSHCGVALQLTDGSVAFPADGTSAMDAHTQNSGSRLKLLADSVSLEIPAGQTAVVDINGKTANITGDGTLYGIDSSNDDYDGCGTASVAGNVAKDVTDSTTGKRYIAVKAEDGTYSFHRLYMRLSTVTLRPNEQCGIYYKAVYECDSILQDKIGAYGVVFSVDDMPGADFKTDIVSNNRYTVYDKQSFVSGETVTSGAIFGIMKTGLNNNAERGEMQIYANAYIEIGGETLVGAGTSYSLFDVLKAMDDHWQKYVDAGKADVIKAFYNMWKDEGMSDWADRFRNIA